MTYIKKIWERKTELILSKRGIYYKRYKYKRKCKERDSFTCQLCGQQKNIDTHHRDNLGAHLVGQKKADNGLDNLLSLCHRCHIRLHYGVLSKHKEIVRLRLSDLTLQEIATQFGVSRQRIHQILIENKYLN